MTTSKEELFQAAVQLERDGKAFYLDLASKASGEATRRMFEALAEDEVKHIDWLEKLAGRKLDLPGANRHIYRRLRGIFVEAPESRRSTAADENDTAAVRLGIEMEEESVAAYEKWAGESETDEVGELCRQIATAERFHGQLLENTLQYLDRTIDWFMEEERWSFDGG